MEVDSTATETAASVNWSTPMLLPAVAPLPQTELKTTVSLCPHCLERVPAKVVKRGEKVFLQKSCPAHGAEEVLLASDATLYWNADQSAGPGCGTGCCSVNHSCTLIFEITEKCNLTCPTCYAGSSPDHAWHLPFEEFTNQLDHLIEGGKGDADIVQLSGGEPTVHPDLERMVEACFERDVQKVYINTNGVRLGTDPDLARRLAEIDAGRDRLQFYLQFDGFEEETNAKIRGAKGLLSVKRKAIRNATDAGLYVAHEVVRQTGGLFSLEDFTPIPCSHPACFGMAGALVHHGEVLPVSRYFPRFETWEDPDIAQMVERFSDRLPTHMLESIAQDEMIETLLDLLTGDEDSKNWADYKNFMVVAIKPFMDAHTYDQDRVDRCCVHIVDRSGQPVSFCEYNAVRRPRGQP